MLETLNNGLSNLGMGRGEGSTHPQSPDSASSKEWRVQRMLELVAKHGVGFKPPSYHEIREKFLKTGWKGQFDLGWT